MTNPESTALTTLRFIDSWRNNDKRLESELLSLHNETNRKIDSYSFEIESEGLVDPNTKRLVKDFVLRDTPIQKIEYETFENLEAWGVHAEEGIMLWISPPSTEYPCAKAIFSRIVYDLGGKKHMANSAILFGNEKTNCTDIVPSLPQEVKEDIRGTLFYIDENDENLFSEIIQNIGEYTSIETNKFTNHNINQAKIFALMIEKGTSPLRVVQEMQRANFLGKHPISCPTMGSATDIMLTNSKIFSFVNYEFKPGVCRVCKQHTHVGPCSICKECEKKFSSLNNIYNTL